MVFSCLVAGALCVPAGARGGGGGHSGGGHSGGRSSSGGRVSVRGYTRRDGTSVAPYTRSAPGSGTGSSGEYLAPLSSAVTPAALSAASPVADADCKAITWSADNLFLYGDTTFRVVGIGFLSRKSDDYDQAKARLLELLSEGILVMRQVGVDSEGHPLVRLYKNGVDIAQQLRREGLGAAVQTGSSPNPLRALYPWAFGPLSYSALPVKEFPALSEDDIQALVEGEESSDQPADTPAALASAASPTTGLTMVHLKVVVVEDLTPRPVPFTDFQVIRTDSPTDVSPVRTDEKGEASLPLPPAIYRIQSRRNTTFKGRLLFWKKEFTLPSQVPSPGAPFELTLTDGDARETPVPAPVAPITSAPVRLAPPDASPYDEAPRPIRNAPPSASTLPLDVKEATHQIASRYEGWKAAWMAMNVEQFLSFYSSSARITRASGDSYGFDTLDSRMRGLWAKESSIRIWDVTSPLIRLYGNKAVLTVTQKYVSSSYTSQGQKRLVWQKQDGEWHIVEEGVIDVQVLQAPQRIAASSSRPEQRASYPGEKFAATRYRFLEQSEVEAWSDTQLRYAINEMFARYGLDFNKPEVKAQFERFSWYRVMDGRTEDEVVALFNPYERANLQLMGRVRRARQSDDG